MAIQDSQKVSDAGDQEDCQLEKLDMFVMPGIALDLEVKYPLNIEGTAGRFAVRGPPRKLAILKYVAQGIDDDGEIDGVVSPTKPITLPTEVKREAGIPLDATSFAFVYPLSYFKRRLHRINLAKEPWGFLHLLGGFAYFDEHRRLLGVNALTIVPQPNVLHLVGPYLPEGTSVDAMKSLGRMTDVVIEGLTDAGMQRFGWVHPGEPPGGHPLTLLDDFANDHGGFMFETAEGPQFFCIHPTEPDGEGYDLNGRLGSALVGLRIALIQDDQIMRRKTERKSAHEEFVRVALGGVVILVLYLACGALVMRMAEGWPVIDAAYFCVVTMACMRAYNPRRLPERACSAQIGHVPSPSAAVCHAMSRVRGRCPADAACPWTLSRRSPAADGSSLASAEHGRLRRPQPVAAGHADVHDLPRPLWCARALPAPRQAHLAHHHALHDVGPAQDQRVDPERPLRRRQGQDRQEAGADGTATIDDHP
jgi:hypothetical protein